NTEDPPTAKSYAYTTPKNTKVFIRLIATDPDPGDSLIYTVHQPLHGALAVPPNDSFPNEFWYTPVAGYAGADSFTFCAWDGPDSSVATITIAVTNTRPIAGDTLLARPAGTPFVTVLPGSDPDGDPLTYSILNPPGHGTLNTDSLPKIIYTHTGGAPASDTLV